MENARMDERTVIKMIGTPNKLDRKLLKDGEEDRNKLSATFAFMVEGVGKHTEEKLEGTCTLSFTSCTDYLLDAIEARFGINIERDVPLILHLGIQEEQFKQEGLDAFSKEDKGDNDAKEEE